MTGFERIEARDDPERACFRMELPRLDASRFSGDLHERNYWSRLGMSFGANACSMQSVRDRYRRQAVGYCPSSELPPRWSRDRERDWAVMFLDADGDEFWFHFPMHSLCVTDAETGLDAETGDDPDALDAEMRAHGRNVDSGKEAL